MNLPNAMSAGRIAAAPFLLILPFVPTSAMRGLAFVLFVAVGLTDFLDGLIARRRKLVTDFGRLLDPLADKFFLVATIIPAFLLMRPRVHFVAPALGIETDPYSYPFVTPLGTFGLPVLVLVIILGRELGMILFRALAARRGVVIGAITVAKWKTWWQAIWIGTAYFWFFLATLSMERQWSGPGWNAVVNTVGVIGVIAMAGAVALTIGSVVVYARRYGTVLSRQAAAR